MHCIFLLTIKIYGYHATLFYDIGLFYIIQTINWGGFLQYKAKEKYQHLKVVIIILHCAKTYTIQNIILALLRINITYVLKM